MFSSSPILAPFAPVNLRDPVNRQHPLNRGRFGWWLTLPGWYGGKNWFDLCGKNHAPVTLVSASGWKPTSRPGGFGNLYAGNGINSADTVPFAFPAVGTADDYAVAMWIRPAFSGTYTPLFDSSSREWVLFVDANGNPSYEGTMTAPITSFTTPLTNGNWWRFVYTRIGGMLRWYINGKSAGSGASTSTVAAATVTMAGPQLGNGTYNGHFDDISFWLYRGLTASDVKSDYDLSRQGYPGVLNRVPMWTYTQPGGAGGPIAGTTGFNLDTSGLMNGAGRIIASTGFSLNATALAQAAGALLASTGFSLSESAAIQAVGALLGSDGFTLSSLINNGAPGQMAGISGFTLNETAVIRGAAALIASGGFSLNQAGTMKGAAAAIGSTGLTLSASQMNAAVSVAALYLLMQSGTYNG